MSGSEKTSEFLHWEIILNAKVRHRNVFSLPTICKIEYEFRSTSVNFILFKKDQACSNFEGPL